MVCSIGDSSPSKFVQIMTWRDIDLFYGKVKFGNVVFIWEKVKTVDFSETIAASDLKVGECRQLIEFLKVCEY